jgi:hypothetical protein
MKVDLAKPRGNPRAILAKRSSKEDPEMRDASANLIIQFHNPLYTGGQG